jgi:catechol 2,3-dioxygenase-like lactoylglutathione lyase family enzyme
LIVERTDFISVPVTNLERSTAWYRETLGLEQIGEGAWPEFQLGENVSLYLIDPTNIGGEFTGRTTVDRAPRPDVEEAEARARGPRRRVRRRRLRHRGLPHGVLPDPDGNALMLHRRYAPRD